MIAKPLPYFQDSTVYFDAIKAKPHAVFLDSCADSIDTGQYDIIAAEPEKWIKCKNGTGFIKTRAGVEELDTDSFALLSEELSKVQEIGNDLPGLLPDLPFYGGAIGYFSYDLGRSLEQIPTIIKDELSIPDMEMGIYHWAIVVDHNAQESFFLSIYNSEYIKKLYAEITTLCTSSTDIENSVISTFDLVDHPVWGVSRPEYTNNINKIKQYIFDGDCYQVNYAQRVSAHYIGSEWSLYKQMRKLNPAPYSAYICADEMNIISCSPEQFVSLNGATVSTKPIKGTVKRSNCTAQDKELATELLNCEKNRAENLMIVDLLRNDLGKVCQPGSIKVSKLFDIESFENIHHLVSTVTGKINSNSTAIDLIKSCFPGGSITGAPKIRAMEIIEELEQSRRGVYCGSIGFISFNGTMNTNIAIRTAITKNNTIYYWAGGGIVADSDADSEYEEVLTKSSAFLSILDKHIKQEKH